MQESDLLLITKDIDNIFLQKRNLLGKKYFKIPIEKQELELLKILYIIKDIKEKVVNIEFSNEKINDKINEAILLSNISLERNQNSLIIYIKFLEEKVERLLKVLDIYKKEKNLEKYLISLNKLQVN